MRRQIGSYASLSGYWPLEDPSGALTLAQTVTGVRSGSFSGTVSLAADPGAGGSDKTLTIGGDGQISGVFRTPAGNGYQVCWSTQLDTAPAGATYGTLFSFTDTLGRTYFMQANATTHRFIVLDADGNTLDSTVIGTVPLTEWTRYRIRVTVSGSTVTYEPAWYTQDASTAWGVTSTFAGTATGRPKTWATAGNTVSNGAAYGHVFAVTDTALDLLSGDARRAFDGYLGERAAVRYSRLMGELGLTGYTGGTAGKSAPMGRQKPGKILDLLTECQVTDGGLIYDEPTDIALMFRVNSNLINQTPVLNLTYGVDVAAPLRKTVDDVGVANDITLTNWDGSQVRVERTAGRLSTAPPPAGVGRYKKPLDASLADVSQLDDRANWELANGTIDRPRYQAVVVDLLAFPGYRPAVTAMRPGDLITLTGLEPDPVTLRVMTIERAGDAVRDTATFTCLPADVWLTGIYDNTVRRADSRSTTLGGAVTSSATALTFSTTDQGDVWSTTSVPYDVVIAGQRNRVTVMTAPSGAGPYLQTATVTRAVNGVPKALAAGEPIHVYQPARYALGGT
jgi:hypothetical protein